MTECCRFDGEKYSRERLKVSEKEKKKKVTILRKSVTGKGKSVRKGPETGTRVVYQKASVE